MMNHAPTGFGWQRGYERVIRNDAGLTAIRKYILANPARRDEDENTPHSLSLDHEQEISIVEAGTKTQSKEED